MEKILKYLCVPITCSLLISCGYQPPEKDKHPDIPIFPEHTNPKIRISPFPFKMQTIHYNEKYYFGYNGELMVLDKRFNVIAQIDTSTPISYIDAEGNIYEVTRKDHEYFKPKEIHRYSPPHFKKEKIELLTLLPREGKTIRDSIAHSLKEELQEGQEENPTLVPDTLIDSILTEESEKEWDNHGQKIKQLKKGLACIFPLSEDISILRYENKEIALFSSYSHTDYLKDIMEEKHCQNLSPIWNLEKSPVSFDKVVLGNSFSGNHYVGGFTPYGYNYIEVKAGSDTTRFKAHNSYNGDGVSILYESGDTTIIRDGEQLYYLSLNK